MHQTSYMGIFGWESLLLISVLAAYKIFSFMSGKDVELRLVDDYDRGNTMGNVVHFSTGGIFQCKVETDAKGGVSWRIDVISPLRTAHQSSLPVEKGP